MRSLGNRRVDALWTVAGLAAACLLLVAPVRAGEAYRVERTQGRVEQAAGPKELVDLVRQGKMTVRALIGWGRLPSDLAGTLVAQREQGADLLGADADTVSARAARVRAGGDAAAAARLERIAELLRRHDFLDWVPLDAGAPVGAGAVLRAGLGSSARLVGSDGKALDLAAESVTVIPPPGPAVATAPTVRPPTPAVPVTPECAAALAELDTPAVHGPDTLRVGYLGDLQIDLPAGWLPIPKPDRQVLAGYFIGDMEKKDAATLGLSIAPAPEAEMVKQIAKGMKADVQGPTPATIGGKAANRYQVATSEGGQPGWMTFHFVQQARADGSHLAIIAGGVGGTGRDGEPVIQQILDSARAAEPPYRLLRRVGGPGEGDGQLDYAEGLGVDAAGHLYVLDAHHYRVQVFDAEGRYLRKWGERGSEPHQLSMPQDLAVAADGSVWVLDDRRVKHYSPEGQFLGLWGTAESPFVPDELFDVGMTLGPDGSLYLTDKAVLKRVSPDGRVLASWPEVPGRVAIDPGGHVVWVDRDRGRVHRHGPDGRPLRSWTVVGTTAATLSDEAVDGFTPESVTTDPDGNLYVGDNDGVVRKYDPSGRFVLQLGPLLFGGEGTGGEPPRLRHVTDMTVDAGGRLYVSDRYQDAVLVFAPSPAQRPRCASGAAKPAAPARPETMPLPPAPTANAPAASVPVPPASAPEAIDDGLPRPRATLRVEPLARQAVNTSAGPATVRHGNLAVTLPAGSLAGPAELVISRVVDPPAAPYAALQPVAAFDVSLGGQSRLPQPVTLELDYADIGLPAGVPAERGLQVAWWNEDYQEWVGLPTRVDASRRTVTVQTNHLTAFGWFMKKLGYGVIGLGDFEVVYDGSLFTPPKENTPEAWASKVIYTGDSNIGRLFPAGLPGYLADPKLPVFLRDLGAYLNYAYGLYRDAGFKMPATPINVLVENTLGEQDFRDKSSGLIHVGASSTGHSLLRRVAAHELFHAVQNEYYWDIGGMTFADWWCDATADYASDVVVWQEARPSRAMKPKFFSSDITATAEEHAYQAAHLVDFLVGEPADKGKAFKAMWESVANADWWNLHDVLYPLAEYLQGTYRKGLNAYFQEFVPHALFHPDSGMPGNGHGSVPAEAMTAWALLRESEAQAPDLTMSLKAGHRAKAWGIRLQAPAGKSRTVPLRLEGPLDGYKRATVHVLPGDRRADSALAPVASFSEQTRMVSVEAKAEDGIYVVVANADRGTGGDYTLKIGAAPLALRLPIVVFALAGEEATIGASLPPQAMPKRSVFIWEFTDTDKVQRTEVPRVAHRYEARDSGLVRVLLYDGQTGALVSVGMTTVVVAVPGTEPGAREGLRTQLQDMSRMLESQLSASLASLPGATLDDKYQAMAQRSAGQPAPTEEERLRALETFAAMATAPADAAAVLAGMRRLMRDPPQRLPGAPPATAP